MGKQLQDLRNEAVFNNAKETAIRMMEKSKMSIEEIAEYVPILSLGELRQLKEQLQIVSIMKEIFIRQ